MCEVTGAHLVGETDSSGSNPAVCTRFSRVVDRLHEVVSRFIAFSSRVTAEKRRLASRAVLDKSEKFMDESSVGQFFDVSRTVSELLDHLLFVRLAFFGGVFREVGRMERHPALRAVGEVIEELMEKKVSHSSQSSSLRWPRGIVSF